MPSDRPDRSRLTRFLWALAAALALAGCEAVVDVPLPAHEPQLVAQGFFAAESLWVVRVTSSVGFTGPQRPGFVDDARVEVWAGDRLEARLVRTDTATYAALAGEKPRPGVAYTLRVAAPGFASVEGTGALPEAPRASFTTTTRTGATPTRRIVRVEMTLQDPPGPTRYALQVLYLHALVDASTGAVNPAPPELFPFSSTDAVLGDPFPNPLDTGAPVYYQALFDDQPFDGASRTVAFEFGYDQTAAPPSGPAIRRAFSVVLLSLSDDLYRYAQTAPQQALFGDNPFAEPLRVHSNMSNGLGVFAGFQPTATLILTDSLPAYP